MPKNTYKTNALTKEYEEKAQKICSGELKRRAVTYAGLTERLDAIGIQETERNLANKIARGGFTAAFLLQCLAAIGANQVALH